MGSPTHDGEWYNNSFEKKSPPQNNSFGGEGTGRAQRGSVLSKAATFKSGATKPQKKSAKASVHGSYAKSAELSMHNEAGMLHVACPGLSDAMLEV
jgi:hypothetical protein